MPFTATRIRDRSAMKSAPGQTQATRPGNVKALQEIMGDAAGRPLSPDEIARSHQYVAMVEAIFEAAEKGDDKDARAN